MIVFTDLDGTLLDHDTYRFDAALPALARLRALAIPVIPATSKTAAELEPLMGELGLDGPAIVENGAGIHQPGATGDDASSYNDIRAAIVSLPASLRRCFTGFGDMDVEEISCITALPAEAARLARKRNHSEPGLFDGSGEDEQRFIAMMTDAGFSVRRGGRFLTIGAPGSKAARMTEIQDAMGATGPVVALGDAPNDIEMLEAADIGIVIANPAHDPLPPLEGEARGTIRRVANPGPAGWNSAINAILDRLNDQEEGQATA